MSMLKCSEVFELEILTFGRRELTTRVNPLAQIVDNAVIAVHTRVSLATGNKAGVAIFKLASAGNKQHTLEINNTLIPARTLLI